MLLESVISHISAAMCEDFVADVVVWFFDEEAGSEDHPVSRGQGELLRGQRLGNSQSVGSCGALQLEKFNPSDWKGPGR